MDSRFHSRIIQVVALLAMSLPEANLSAQTTQKPSDKTPRAAAVKSRQSAPPNSREGKKAAGKTNGDETKPIAVGDGILKVTLSSSETPLKLGSTSNIAADIQNVSNGPVEIDLGKINLIGHAVLAPEYNWCSFTMFASRNDAFSGPVILQAQDHVSMIFDLSRRFGQPDPNDAAQVKSWEDYRKTCEPRFHLPFTGYLVRYPAPSLFRLLDFSPGNYDFFFSGNFSVCAPASDEANGGISNPKADGASSIPSKPGGAGFVCGPTDVVRQLSQSATFPVAISQTSIVIFSIFGGLFAFLVVTANSSEDTSLNDFIDLWRKTPEGGSVLRTITSRDGLFAICKVLVAATGAALLAAAFTVVSSRLSDTHFPINVTVQDAWGAITVGFVSYFVGQRFIRWLTEFGQGGNGGASAPSTNGGGRRVTVTTPRSKRRGLGRL